MSPAAVSASLAAPVLSFDTPHEDMIHDAQLDFHARKLATASSDRSIRIFDVPAASSSSAAAAAAPGSLRPVAEIRQAHDGPVWAVAWAHPRFGTLLASCSYDRKVKVWTPSQQPINQNQGSSGGGMMSNWVCVAEYTHNASANAVAFAPPDAFAGPALASVGSDGVLSLVIATPSSSAPGGYAWPSAGITVDTRHSAATCVSWAPFSAAAASSTSSSPNSNAVRRIATGGCDNRVRLFKFDGASNSFVPERDLVAHSDWVRDVAFAPFAYAPNRETLVSASQDKSVVVWSIEAGKDVEQKVINLGAVVWRVSWGGVGGVVAATCADGRVVLLRENAAGEWVKVVEQDAQE
eukprot:ANDGO_07890.mRNA.1 Protein transport protein SEC13